jgi:hypothetical protein
MEGEEMNETPELCCPKMHKAIDKQWVKIHTYPRNNIIEFMIDSIVLIYCPFCGEYLPETSDVFASQSGIRETLVSDISNNA